MGWSSESGSVFTDGSLCCDVSGIAVDALVEPFISISAWVSESEVVDMVDGALDPEAEVKGGTTGRREGDALLMPLHNSRKMESTPMELKLGVGEPTSDEYWSQSGGCS